MPGLDVYFYYATTCEDKPVSELTDLVGAIGSSVSAVAACVAAVGVWYARHQLKTSREIAQLQFEDALSKEYRELAGELSKKALMGLPLSDLEFEACFDGLYRYIDLTNEQVSLGARGRITFETWESWRDGIKANLNLSAFSKAWTEIKAGSEGFEELRRLERDEFKTDPREWCWSSR